MTENLRQHRGVTDIWQARAHERDAERWLALLAAGVCLAAGVRHRSAGGFALAILGGAVAWWAAADADERQARRAALDPRQRRRRTADQAIDEASEDSFPASDPPAAHPADAGR